MKTVRNIAFSLCFAFSVASCIEEYEMPSYDSGDFQPELVVQGYIVSGETSVIYLSKTVPFYDENSEELVLNAKVTIVGQNGYESQEAEYDLKEDCYVLETTDLPSTTLYAVKVEHGGEIYQSNFAALLDSPDIDEVTYKETQEGVGIHVSTFAEADDSRFYMWSFEEDWEFHAEVDLLWPSGGVYLYNEATYPMEETDFNPYYYCWGHNHSSHINIYATDDLTKNHVVDYKLHEIPYDDIRISYLYSILVKQWSLTEEAYNYYRIMKLYTENNNTLFPVMPDKLVGNVTCVSNPEITVRGYVTSANVKTKRIFIYESELEQSSTYSGCHSTLPPDPPYSGWNINWMGYVNYYGHVALTKQGALTESSILYEPECVNCLLTEGADKKRPDFWPNDHR